MMKRKMKKVISLGLIGSFSFFTMTSCSTQVNLLSWGPFSEPQEIQSSYHGQISQFVSKVRPRPGNPDSHYLLARYYQQGGEHEKAIEEFQKVILIEPRHVQAHNEMGVSYDHLKDYARAVESYQRALLSNPDLDYVLNNLGYSYLLQGNPDEAIPVIQKAIFLNGREGKFHNNLGLAYAVKGDLDQALAEFKLAGDESKAHFNIAQFYHQRGLYRIAQFHYSQALSLDPSFHHAKIASQGIDALARIFQPPTKEEEKGMAEEGTAQEAMLPPDEQAARGMAVSSTPEMQVPVPVPPESGRVLLSAVDSEWLARGQEDLGALTAELNPVFPPAPKTEPAPPSSVPAVKEKNSSLKKAEVEVSNGNGVNGMARKVSSHLQKNGVPVRRVTNANHYNYRQTLIFYQNGYQEAAVQVADQIPGLQNLEEQKKFDRANINVKVIIGKDILSVPELKGGGKS
jgi:Flp pilus assembly protein TadD